MRRGNYDAGGDVDLVVSDKETRKQTITEQRREQNRRAQRVFRERRRAKKKYLNSNPTPRHLAPRVPVDTGSRTAKSSEADEILHWIGQTSSTNTMPSSTSSHVFSDALTLQDQPHQQRQSPAHIVQETIFTFSSPQTLLPAHNSLIPKGRSPTSEVQAFLTATNRPGHTLWPHGAPPTLAACLFNAAAMGIDIDRVGEPKYMSPFYRPSFSATLSSPSPPVHPTTTTTTTTSSTSPTMYLSPGPRSLRPCFAQVIFPHHACLDLLPLPKLRETAIMLVVRRAQQDGRCAMDSSSDHAEVQELKRDVYVRQGVRFRGTGELTREEYVLPDDESSRHCGNPWEGGSWAVSPWFAVKWKHLIDL
ncbi:hypothetical protein LTS17_008436 [Exophiala oligosperma]